VVLLIWIIQNDF